MPFALSMIPHRLIHHGHCRPQQQLLYCCSMVRKQQQQQQQQQQRTVVVVSVVPSSMLQLVRQQSYRTTNGNGLSAATATAARFVTSTAVGNSKLVQKTHQRFTTTTNIIQNNKRMSSIPMSPSIMNVVKALRYRTGAPIVDCKKAIQQATTLRNNNNNNNDDNNNGGTTTATTTTATTSTTATSTNSPETDETILFETALDWLRSHSATKTSNKVAGRITSQGLVAIQISSPSDITDTTTEPSSSTAAMVKIASETDFAALSLTFTQLIQTVVQTTLAFQPPSSSSSPITTITPETILQQPAVVAVVNGTNSSSTATTIQDCLNEAIVSIRENITITDVIHLIPHDVVIASTNDHQRGIYVGYVHNKVEQPPNMDVLAGTAAAIVLLVPTTPSSSSPSLSPTPTMEDIQLIGKQLAMHIVAAKPMYMSIADIPMDVVQKEREIIQLQIQNDVNNSKKPKHILELIIQGKLQKYYETICLLEQSHMIVEHNPKIASYLQQHQLTLQHYVYKSI